MTAKCNILVVTVSDRSVVNYNLYSIKVLTIYNIIYNITTLCTMLLFYLYYCTT